MAWSDHLTECMALLQADLPQLFEEQGSLHQVCASQRRRRSGRATPRPSGVPPRRRATCDEACRARRGAERTCLPHQRRVASRSLYSTRWLALARPFLVHVSGRSLWPEQVRARARFSRARARE